MSVASAPDRRSPAIACVGTFIFDVLGRPIDVLPTTQQAVIVDEIRTTVAGTAGGTAVDLARLGARVAAIGAVGADNAGRFVRTLLAEEGVDASRLATKDGVPTSATMLPISSDGVRPAWHLPGANSSLGPGDVDLDALRRMDAVHYGGVSALPGLDGEPARELLATARAAGALTTADCLGIKREDAFEVLLPMLSEIEVFMPNLAEATTLTGVDSPAAAAAALRAAGANAVIVKLDADGCLGVDDGGGFELPALEVEVVDSTGCGDAFCAGVIFGLLAGWPLKEAARLGTAAGALTASGLGSDAGIRDLDSTLEFMRTQGKE